MRADHGGNVRVLAEEAGLPAAAILDWSANINPFGLPPRVRAALLQGMESIVHYPDPDAINLRESLAAFHGLPRESVLVGNGETELIYLTAQAFRPKRALAVVPAFSEYAHALELVDCQIESFRLSEASSFLPDTDSVLSALEGCDALVLANPNNPTGSLIDPANLLTVVEACEERGIFCVLDEAFIDWVEPHSLKAHAARARNLLVLRSLTKFYALPGLRVGYAIGHADRIALLRRWQPTWSVNALAQVAGVAAIEDTNYREQSLEVIPRIREAFRSSLATINGIRVFPSEANFLLLKLTAPGWNGPTLRAALLAKGMAVRETSSFEGLGPLYLRVAVRLPEENARLVEVLKGLLGCGAS